MFDIFLRDPNEIPLPPAEVRILDLQAQISPEGRRVRVFLEVTPFQKRPNAEVVLRNPFSDTVASVSIIETIDRRMEFTMHVRDPRLEPGSQPNGTYQLSATVFYTDIPAPAEGEEPGAPPPAIPEEPLSTIVDQRQISVEFRVD